MPIALRHNARPPFAEAPQGLLDDGDLASVVKSAPLVAIDLIIRDSERNVLTGLRNNEPAKDYYFVPGGRVRKGESLESAFVRILKAETGCVADFEESSFLGVYEHLYANNRFGHEEYGTHYVVLAYEVSLSRRPVLQLDPQHRTFEWMSEAELKAAPMVHRYTKAYFET